MACGSCGAETAPVMALGASSGTDPSSAAPGAASAASVAAVESGLAAHVADRSDPHRTLDRVPGTLLGRVDPSSAEGYLPGTRYVNLETKAEFIASDVGRGFEWVPISAGGWSSEELASALARFVPAESMAGYVSKPELAGALAGYVPLSDAGALATGSEARGYAQDALSEAKAYADAAAEDLRAYAAETASARAAEVAAAAADLYAGKADVAGLAVASDVEAALARTVRADDASGAGTPISALLEPYARTSGLADAFAARAEVGELRRQTVYLRGGSESGFSYPVPGHDVRDVLRGYVTQDWLQARGYMDSEAVAGLVRDYVEGSWWPAQAGGLADPVVPDGAIDPASFNAASSAAVAAYVDGAVRSATWNYLSYRAALAGLMPGGVLMDPLGESLSGSGMGLDVSTATTSWATVPVGASSVSLAVSVYRPGGRENPGTESSAGWSDIGDGVTFELPPSRDAVVVLEFAPGWTPSPSSRLRFPDATAVYGADSDALSLASCSAGDVVAVAVHELKDGVYMVSRRPLVPQADFR